MGLYSPTPNPADVMTATNPTKTNPTRRLIERWIGILITMALTPVAVYYAVGVLGLPIERFVDLDPTTRFDDVRRLMSPLHLGALFLAGGCVMLSLVLQVLDSRWSIIAHILYFAGAKTAWVLAAFLANYDGLLVGAVTSVFQLSVLVILIRTQGQKWFTTGTS